MPFDPLSLPAAYLLASMAATDQCPMKHNFPLEFTYHYNPPPIVHTKSLKAMNKEYGSHSGAYDKKKIAGYTTNAFKWQIYIHFDGMISPVEEQRRNCFVPDGMSFTVTFSPEIFMPREYKKGSCDYQYVLKHEMRHIDVMKQQIEKFMPGIRKKLTARIHSILPKAYPLSKVKPEQDRILENIEAYAKELVDGMQKENRKLQLNVDSKESHRIEEKEYRKCMKGKR